MTSRFVRNAQRGAQLGAPQRSARQRSAVRGSAAISTWQPAQGSSDPQMDGLKRTGSIRPDEGGTVVDRWASDQLKVPPDQRIFANNELNLGSIQVRHRLPVAALVDNARAPV